MNGPARQRGVLLALAAAFALLAGLHAWRVPLHEGPDEPGNLQHLQFVAVERRLVAPARTPTHELEVMSRGITPPLWFVTLAPVVVALGADEWRATEALEPRFMRRDGGREGTRLHYRHGRDEHGDVASPAVHQYRLLRATGIAFALVALGALLATARLVAPLAPARGRARFAVLATALAAATPQLQHLTGVLTMDIALAAFGSLALLQAARWQRAEQPGRARRAAAWAGLWAALAALTKLNGLVLLPALVWAGWAARSASAARWSPTALAALVVLAVAGPWYLWGLVETGHPLWVWHYQQVSPFHNPPGYMPDHGPFERWSVFALLIAMTWLGDFAWTSVWFPLPATVLVAVLFAGATGAAVALWCGARGRRAWAFAAVPALAAAGLAASWIEPWRQAFTSGALEYWGSFGAIVAALGLVAFGLARGRYAAPPAERPDDGVVAASTDGGRERALARGTLGFLLVGAATMLAAEVFFNLRFNQPQARHLYPFLVAFVVPIALGFAVLRVLGTVVLLHAVLAVLGLALVETHLRPPGWNESALFHATDALRRGPGDPGRVVPRWVAPDDGSRHVESPTLVFEDPGGGAHEVVFGLDNPDLADFPWRPRGALVRSSRDLCDPLEGTRVVFAIPPGLWAGLAPGDRIDVEVSALDPDGAVARRGQRLTLFKGP